MRKFVQQHISFAAIDLHQLCERKMRRELDLVRAFPARHRKEETRQTMRIAVLVLHRFARAEQLAMVVGKLETVHDLQVELAHLRAPFPVTAL